MACSATAVDSNKFNPMATIPCGCTTDHIKLAMEEFMEFLNLVNSTLNAKGIARLEGIMMQANFSSLVGEFISSTLPRHCLTITKNRYHNGHPDLVPKGHYADDKVQHGSVGIEIKASRRKSGWQGHNAEDTWLMVFVFVSNTPVDTARGIKPIPFRFVAVYGAELVKADWTFAGRSATSRRTITAGINESGLRKLKQNWIYSEVPVASKNKKATAKSSKPPKANKAKTATKKSSKPTKKAAKNLKKID